MSSITAIDDGTTTDLDEVRSIFIDYGRHRDESQESAENRRGPSFDRWMGTKRQRWPMAS